MEREFAFCKEFRYILKPLNLLEIFFKVCLIQLNSVQDIMAKEAHIHCGLMDTRVLQLNSNFNPILVV